MAALSASPMLSIGPNSEVDKLLTYEIFSILENKFLFGYDDDIGNKPNHSKLPSVAAGDNAARGGSNGKVRILSIDGGGATGGILAADALCRLEAALRRKSGNPHAAVADYFDVVAGSGTGGVLAALLFTRAGNGPMFSAEEALGFMVKNRRKISRPAPAGILRRVFRSERRPEKLYGKVFGECTLKDTLKSVLIPCYDLASRAPFLFSRADAVEMDGYDFKMRDVCAATSADPTAAGGALEVGSVDRKTRILAVDGGIAMNNPTAAAITHVLNNKQEFPLCHGVEDLIVISLGNGESEFGAGSVTASPATAGMLRIAGEGASDLVDQAVSMAFGECRTNNYVRIQGNSIIAKNQGDLEKAKVSDKKKMDILAETENMLAQKNVESVLFRGKKIVANSNLEKIELFAGELVKEQERRKTSILPMVTLKQMSHSPRTSSATTLSTLSSN